MSSVLVFTWLYFVYNTFLANCFEDECLLDYCIVLLRGLYGFPPVICQGFLIDLYGFTLSCVVYPPMRVLVVLLYGCRYGFSRFDVVSLLVILTLLLGGTNI